MSGIQGIGGVAGPGNPSGKPRVAQNAENLLANQDEVALSTEAQDASEAARLSAVGSAVRAEAVARARQNIEQGTFRLQKVVLEVAARISPYVANE